MTGDSPSNWFCPVPNSAEVPGIWSHSPGSESLSTRHLDLGEGQTHSRTHGGGWHGVGRIWPSGLWCSAVITADAVELGRDSTAWRSGVSELSWTPFCLGGSRLGTSTPSLNMIYTASSSCVETDSSFFGYKGSSCSVFWPCCRKRMCLLTLEPHLEWWGEQLLRLEREPWSCISESPWGRCSGSGIVGGNLHHRIVLPRSVTLSLSVSLCCASAQTKILKCGYGAHSDGVLPSWVVVLWTEAHSSYLWVPTFLTT